MCLPHGVEQLLAGSGVGGAAADGTTGIRGIADRVNVLGGVLTVHSPPSKGTHIAAETPLPS